MNMSNTAVVIVMAISLFFGIWVGYLHQTPKPQPQPAPQVQQAPPQGRFRYLHKCNDTTTVEYRADRKLPQAVVCGE